MIVVTFGWKAAILEEISEQYFSVIKVQDLNMSAHITKKLLTSFSPFSYLLLKKSSVNMLGDSSAKLWDPNIKAFLLQLS